MGLMLVKKFKGISGNDTANAVRTQHNGNNSRIVTGIKCKEEHPPCVRTHSYEYCDTNPNTKDPKGSAERNAKRKAMNGKRSSEHTQGYSRRSEFTNSRLQLLHIRHY